MSTTFIAAEAVGRNSKRFHEVAETNPCDGCPAPCCRMVLSPYPTPTTLMEMDYVRYLLGFPSITMLLDRSGAWQQVVEQQCALLDELNRCSVHATPRKPKTCVYFNPYQCWYKRTFVTGDATDVVRIDATVFEEILAHVSFDENGTIAELPTWESIQTLAATPACDDPVTPS